MTHTFCPHTSDEEHIRRAANEIGEALARPEVCTVELFGEFFAKELVMGAVLAAIIGTDDIEKIVELQAAFLRTNMAAIAQISAELAHDLDLRRTQEEGNA